MTPETWYALVGAGLVGIGLYSLILSRIVLRKIIALNIMGGGTFLVLVSISKRQPSIEHAIPDPVPQAMVLTGIVVAVSATALALALARRYFEATRRLVLPEDSGEWNLDEEPPPHVLEASEEGGDDAGDH